MEQNGAEVKDGDQAHKKDHDEPRQFACKYCKKKFSNCQALGGHQNAHKLERALSKSKAGMGNAIPGFGYQGNYNVYPYPNVVFPTQPYPELVPFTSTRPAYAHTPFVGLGHTFPSWSRPETRNYEAPRNHLILGGTVNPILDRGSSSVVHGVTSSNVTDYMSVLDDSRKKHKGNSELDLTLKL